MNPSAAPGIAVREFPMLTGEADYLLYAAGKAIGVVEAKPKGHPLIGVETQSARYAGALPPEIPAHARPLSFSYESTGAVTQFTNLLHKVQAKRQATHLRLRPLRPLGPAKSTDLTSQATQSTKTKMSGSEDSLNGS